jgi:hypothetical protein
MVFKVKNKETGKFIKKGGSVYNKLLESGIDLSNEKTIRVKKFKANESVDKEHLRNLKKNESFAVDKSEGVSWKEKKPHTTKERNELMDKCGKDAFLLPSRKKFPICNKITKEDDKCSYNCKGLKAASSRAGEWGYKTVLNTSKRLTKELDCYKDKKNKDHKKKNENKKNQNKNDKKNKDQKKKIENKKDQKNKDEKGKFFRFIDFIFG